MANRPVLEAGEIAYKPVTEEEIKIGIAYAKAEHKRDLDEDMLKILVNTTLSRREPESILPKLAATVIREAIPLKNKDEAPKIEAYKSAVMKILSVRSTLKRQSNARKRKAGLLVPFKANATKHPEDPKHKGQLLLL